MPPVAVTVKLVVVPLQIVGFAVTEPMTGSSFEHFLSPVSRASDVVSAFAWHRGDVKTSQRSIEFAVKPDMVFSKNSLNAIGSDYSMLFTLMKTGISYPVKTLEPVLSFNPDIKVTPDEFTRVNGSVSKDYVVTENDGKGQALKKMARLLRDRNILPEGNITDPEKKIFQSETGEILFNTEKQTMTVVSPRLEGAVVKENVPVSLGSVAINSCSVPASVSVISLNKEQIIKNSKRLLVVLSTETVSSETVFATEKRNCVIDFGTFPVLLRTAEISLTIKTNEKNVPEVYALNMDGTREETIPCSLADGKLSLNISTDKLKYATPFFEIVFSAL